MSEPISKLDLATHVVSQMDYTELHDSAITGLVQFYEANPDKFTDDAFNEGFVEKIQNYVVEWRIDMTAASPEEAAAKALIVMRDSDPANTATVFSCTDESGDVHSVDLDQIRQDANQ